jgi:hypothetical protein
VPGASPPADGNREGQDQALLTGIDASETRVGQMVVLDAQAPAPVEPHGQLHAGPEFQSGAEILPGTAGRVVPGGEAAAEDQVGPRRHVESQPSVDVDGPGRSPHGPDERP